MNEGELVKGILSAILAVGALVLVMMLRGLSTNREHPFRIADLLIGADGKASKAAVVLWGGFILSSWVILCLTLHHELTEGYLGLYIGAFVAPTITQIISVAKQSQGEK